MTRALVVVDVQNDFVEGGSLAVAGGQLVSHRIADSISRFREGNSDLFDYIVATKDFHNSHSDNGGHFGSNPDYVDTWPAHCVQGTEGALFAPGLSEVAQKLDAIFYKGDGEPAYSGFQGRRMSLNGLGGDGLHEWLQDRGVDSLVICGIATDYCVKATALDAIELGYRVRLPESLTVAVGGREARIKAIEEVYTRAGMEMMPSEG